VKGKHVYLPGGDVTRSRAQLLVNTVNVVGVMGAGVALAFKKAWPAIMPPYKEACRDKTLRPGGCLLFPLPDGPNGTGRLWAALATKEHWLNPSKLTWIDTGLAELARLATAAGVRTIALPPPGCGHGKLKWTQVHPLVLKHLGDFDLEIYAEQLAPAPGQALGQQVRRPVQQSLFDARDAGEEGPGP